MYSMDRLQYNTLWEALKDVPDPRHAHGKQYPWLFLLTLLGAALLAGKCQLSEISDWVQWQGEEIRDAWPEPLPGLPSYATLRRTLLGVDIQILEQVVAIHAQTLTPPARPRALEAPPKLRAQAVDGKTLRGTLKYGAAAQTQLVSLVQQEPVRVLAQQRVGAKANDITAVAKLLKGRNLRQVVITLDALLTQKTIARQILKQHGDYLMVVKMNQPELWSAIDLLFRQPPWLPREQGAKRVHTHNGGHGRLERRTLEASTWLNDYLEWPGVQQVLRRTCYRKELKTGKVSRTVTYGITSPSPARASVKELEQFWRGHWSIENGVHYVRDETMGEDRCQVHSGVAAQALAALRNGILNAVRHRDWKNMAAAMRYFGSSPKRAFELVRGQAFLKKPWLPTQCHQVSE
jgi:predicted transposase YbfD/YdcC